MPAKLSKSERQRKNTLEAAKRRTAKAQAHAAMQARHNERRAVIEQYEAAWSDWNEANCVGPEPIHPDNVQGGIVLRSDAGTGDDLIAQAEALGIDLSA